MSEIHDITGKVYGKLTVIRMVEKRKLQYFWECLCECGNYTIVGKPSLRDNGGTKSCGCITKDKLIDLTNKVFTYLTVIERSHTIRNIVYWKCQCKCGNVITTRGSRLRGGLTMSCGCYNLEQCSKRAKTHGLSKSPEYKAYYGIKERCYNEKEHSYKNYGARGITMSEEWLESFETFYRDMGKRPSKKHSIERKNVNGNYEINNCYWATMDVQANNRRNNRLIEYNGEIKTISQWAQTLGLSRRSVQYRLSKG